MSAVDVRTQADAKSIQERAVPWWLVLIGGIATVVVGLFLVFVPAETTLVLVQFLGLYWLISGVLSLVSIFVGRSQWGWKLLSGLLGVVAGFIIIRHPAWSAVIVPTTLVVVVAALGIIVGIAFIAQAFTGGGWGAGILGAMSIILSLVLFLSPFFVTALLPLVLGAIAIVGGICATVASFALRGESPAFS
jgi:uncharacterized membrane protein HdeD (DUF308 family)